MAYNFNKNTIPTLFGSSNKNTGRRHKAESVSSLNEIEASLNKLGRIIELYGTNYLPLFENLNAYYEERLNNKSSLDIALDRAKKYQDAQIND